MKPTRSRTRTSSAIRLQQFRRQGYYFRYAAMLTLVMGISLHVVSLLIGRERFLQFVLTPEVDILLAIPMTYAGITGWLAWKRVVHRSRLHRIVYGFLVIYFSISIPVHAQTIVTGRTDRIIRLFPEGYSLAILPVLLALLIFVWRLQFTTSRHAG